VFVTEKLEQNVSKSNNLNHKTQTPEVLSGHALLLAGVERSLSTLLHHAFLEVQPHFGNTFSHVLFSQSDGTQIVSQLSHSLTKQYIEDF